MLRSTFLWISFCARAPRFLSFVVAISVIGFICWTDAILNAAPITFQFDATVTDVFPGTPLNLPVNLAIGDVIHSKFTFEPGSGGPLGDNAITASQAFAIEFEINGTVLATSSYYISVFNDTGLDDSDFEAPLDLLALGCSEPSCVPDLISMPESDEFRIRSRMQLVGSSLVLNMPVISSNPATWNAFVLERRLNLDFANEELGAIGLQAAVGDFRIVPEPESQRLAVMILVFTAAVWRTKGTKGTFYFN